MNKVVLSIPSAYKKNAIFQNQVVVLIIITLYQHLHAYSEESLQLEELMFSRTIAQIHCETKNKP